MTNSRRARSMFVPRFDTLGGRIAPSVLAPPPPAPEDIETPPLMTGLWESMYSEPAPTTAVCNGETIILSNPSGN